MAKLRLSPQRPKVVKIIPNPKIIKVGEIVPAGGRVLPEAVAMFAGTSPIVSVNVTVVEPEVIVTGLSPKRSFVGVQDQLPDESAVAETD